MDKKANDTFAFDLENRLDDFFSDALPSEEAPSAEASPEADAQLPLKDLKSTILAIDWEITDDALNAFIDHVDGLMDPYKGDKAVTPLLKILRSLGNYLRAHKSKAHPDTIKRIMSVYATLEEAVSSDEWGPEAKEKSVLEEVKQFQRLKAQIVESRSPRPADRSRRPSTVDKDAVLRAIEALKAMMADELSAIREELKRHRHE